MSQVLVVLLSAALGAVGGAVGVGWRPRTWKRMTSGDVKPLTRLDAHQASATPAKAERLSSAASAGLRRDAQKVIEATEATQDLEVLDRLLRDIRDLTSADEVIFWRWIEARQTLLPNAWSTEGEPRPRFFDMTGWGPLVKWSAEEGKVQFGGDVEGAPMIAVAPVYAAYGVFGVITVAAKGGLQFDRDTAREWMARFASQVASLVQLFDVRRDYGQTKRQSAALLEAVKRLQGHRTPEALAQALCDTAREVTSGMAVGIVRWNSTAAHGVVQAISPETGVDSGFHVTADTIVGGVCADRLPLILPDAASATSAQCPYGGQPRPVGSLVVVPIIGTDGAIGALVVEGREAGDVSAEDARNIGLLAAVARGPLESIWEIEEVSRRARTDALTGLANRRHFDEQLQRVIAETDRFGGTCSLVLVDLDHFKSINDQRGHDAGDVVLKHVAQVLSDGVRAVDLCARYGGEEIAVLLPQTSEAGAAELAERLRRALESRPLLYGGEHIRVTASFGVSTYPVPVPYGDWLVLAADKALYKAKAGGRNCVKVIQANHVTPALYKARP